MKTLYLDLFSGIAGDMFVGALIDLGADPHQLAHELEKLGLEGYHLHVTQGEKSAIAGIKFDVHLEHEHEHEHEEDDDHHHHGEGEHHHHEHGHGHGHDHSHAHEHTHESACGATYTHSHEHSNDDPEHQHGHGQEPEQAHAHGQEHDHECCGDEGHHHHDDHRTFADIREIITRSSLSAWVKTKSIGVFQRIAEAEGKIHGLPAEQVHFHEVGAIDSIVDIVGAAIALELLGRPRVLASAVTEGTGWIQCAHGRFPVPAPATLAILGARGIPVSQCAEPHELVTPTGAALLAEFAESFAPMQDLIAEKIGFGLGTRENKTRPNVLRAILGEIAPDAQPQTPDPDLGWESDHIAVLETNLDDCTGEILGSVVETALAAGALDVFHTPIQMKKNRPGVLLTILCAETDADKFSELLLRETTAFGIRRTFAERRKLPREFTSVPTAYGDITVKVGRLGGQIIQVAPEFESVKKLAGQSKTPVRQVATAAVRAAASLKSAARPAAKAPAKARAKAKPAAKAKSKAKTK